MAVTLADLARQETSPLKKNVMMNLLRYSDLMQVVPFEKVSSLTNVVVRWNTLPTTAYRQVNGTYTESTGVTEQVSEGVYALGGEVKYDRVFDMVTNVVEDVKKTQTLMKTRSMAFTFNDSFINGDHATNVDQPEGINKRIASYLPSRQSLSIGTAFDVTANVASEHKLIDYVHDLLDLAGLRDAPMVQLKKGDKQPMKNGVLLMNRAMFLGFGRVARRAGVLMTTQDSWGRLFDSFAGVPMIDVGLKSDKSTEIITNTYGGSSNETRLFAVRFGSEDGLTGIQLNSPDAYDPIAAGEGAGNVTGPQKLLRIDWWHGFAGYGSYYASRLTGVLAPGSWT